MKQIVADCDKCNGSGRFDGGPCLKCGGSGRILRLVSDDTPGALPAITVPDPKAGPSWAQVVIAICSTLSAIAGAASVIYTSQTHAKVEQVQQAQEKNATSIQSIQKEVKASRQEAKDREP